MSGWGDVTLAEKPVRRVMSPKQEQAALSDYTAETCQILIEHVQPEVDCGRYPVKRVVGDSLEVQADIFRDGHAVIGAALKYRQTGAPGTAGAGWQEVRMRVLENDRWSGRFPVTALGRYSYQIEAWNDRFGTWQRDMAKRVQASQVSPGDVQEGVSLVREAAGRMPQTESARLANLLSAVGDAATPLEAGALFLAGDVTELLDRYPDRSSSALSRELDVIVDPVRARFSAWYELFPRSQGKLATPGTLGDVIAQLPRIAGMGFDVLYLPPIHPIGRTNRKGPNNSLNAGADDVGSPWAIGNENGGHKAIDTALGTFEDFAALVQAASNHGIQIAMDYAIQCSPDHPYVKEHPEWFFIGPDGSIKYAENPPKKY